MLPTLQNNRFNQRLAALWWVENPPYNDTYGVAVG